jgi:hypothetical protein
MLSSLLVRLGMFAAAAGLSAVLAGCDGGGAVAASAAVPATASPGAAGSGALTSTGGPTAASPGSAGSGASPGSAALSVSGSPPSATLVGKAFLFQPTTSHPNGRVLSFSIVGQPNWTSFDPSTGTLAGTPLTADVGSYSVTIRASAGSLQASLPFTVNVVQVTTGRATVSWVPPLHRTDGTPLQNLAGFRVYYGTQPAALADVIHIGTPGATSVVVENLTPGTWYFATTAIDASGLESARSAIASKRI